MNKENISFQKVSLNQFKKDFIYPIMSEEYITSIYNNIKLPQRSTSGSAGYDFYIPYNVDVMPNEEILIPTGIKCYIPEGMFLLIAPRSGLGTKNRFQLNNTIGIIDSDYFFSDNEGHIMLKMINDSRDNKILHLTAGQGIAQGIFLKYYVSLSDKENGRRNGGFGSTDNNIL